LAPGQAPAHEVRARALLALGRYEQAEEAFDDYLNGGGEAVPDVFRGRGLARMKRGRYPEAAEDYARVAERAPGADVYQHLGWAHFFADAWKLALRDFARAIELDPEGSDAYTGRGLARVMLGHYRGAVADAGAALRRKPGGPEMMHNLACLFAQAPARAEADRGERAPGALADGYRRRAVDAVQQALEMVRPEERRSFWRDKVLPDPALAPIRNEAGFERLRKHQGDRG
jgi:tetratricopeptide (TPR) repeat protein